MPPDPREHLAACVERGRFTPAEAALIRDYLAEVAARGVASAGDRVLCVYAEGIGYVASVIAAA